MSGITMKQLYKHLKLQLAAPLFLVIALIAGGITAHMVPPLWGVDESTHFNRVYQLSRGQALAQPTSGGGYGGVLPGPLVDLSRLVARDLGNNVQPSPPLAYRDDVDDRAAYRNATDRPVDDGRRLEWDFTGAAAYSYLAYPGALAGMYLAGLVHADLGQVVMAARWGTLLLYVGLITTALLLLGRRTMAWLIAAIALLPMALFQAATMNPDALLIGYAALLVSTVVWLHDQRMERKRWQIWTVLGLAAGAAIMLPLVKPVYAPLSFLVATVPPRIWSGRWKYWTYVTATLGVMTALVALWATKTSAVVDAVSRVYAHDPNINAGRQIKHVLTQPWSIFQAAYISARDNDDIWITGILGRLGWNFVLIPTVAIVMAVLAMAAGVIARISPEGSSRRHSGLGWVCIGLGVGTILCVIGSFYAGFSPVGAHVVLGVQGRYFLPPLVFILCGVHLLVVPRLQVNRLQIAVMISGLTSATLIVALLSYARAL